MQNKIPSPDTGGRYIVMHTKVNQYTHEDHKKIRHAQMNPKEGLQCNGDKYTQTDPKKDQCHQSNINGSRRPLKEKRKLPRPLPVSRINITEEPTENVEKEEGPSKDQSTQTDPKES